VFLDFVPTGQSRLRIVAEPDARNDKAIARLIRTGFVAGPEIQLPEKRAQVVVPNRDTIGRRS